MRSCLLMRGPMPGFCSPAFPISPSFTLRISTRGSSASGMCGEKTTLGICCTLTLIKKKINFSSYIRKFRRDSLQTHIWLRFISLIIYGYIFAHFLTYQETLPHLWLFTWSHLNFLIYDENFVFFYQWTRDKKNRARHQFNFYVSKELAVEGAPGGVKQILPISLTFSFNCYKGR